MSQRTVNRGNSSDEAVAVLFSGDPDTGETNFDVFRESESAEYDPITRAEALMRSCEDDFPTRLWSFTGNDRARELRSDYLTQKWLGVDA